MSNISLIDQLIAVFPEIEFQSEVQLAPFTAVKIGGPAEVLATLNSAADLRNVTIFCHQHQIPLTVLGWGANTLIADRGIRGLVIRNLARDLEVSDQPSETAIKQINPPIEPRYQSTEINRDFSELDYSEDSAPAVQVTVASGWPLASLIASLLAQGITGLQWYSRIPATIGGAVVNNIHGGTHFFGESVLSVEVVTETGETVTRSAAECDFGYDYSRFHRTREVIISCQLQLRRGDVAKAQQVVADWAKRKQHQPQNSLGCIFQNLAPQEQARLELPAPSVGYVIDKVLQLKSLKIGDAAISEYHAAFIVNTGTATAADYLQLIRQIQQTAQQELQLQLKPEIFFAGFEPAELADVVAGNSP
jgi:UDP-N-acetylmuramate dehydrogenase